MASTLAHIKDPNGRYLAALWAILPSGPMSRDELHAHILRAKGIDWHDDATANGLRSSLTAADAVLAYRQDDGSVVYEKAKDFPIHEPNGVGTPAFNRELQRLAEEEHELQDRAAQSLRENDPQHRAFQEMLSIVDARVAEHLDVRVTALIDERFDDVAEQLEHAVDRTTVEKIRALLKRRKENAATSGTE